MNLNELIPNFLRFLLVISPIFSIFALAYKINLIIRL